MEVIETKGVFYGISAGVSIPFNSHFPSFDLLYILYPLERHIFCLADIKRTRID